MAQSSLCPLGPGRSGKHLLNRTVVLPQLTRDYSEDQGTGLPGFVQCSHPITPLKMKTLAVLWLKHCIDEGTHTYVRIEKIIKTQQVCSEDYIG